MIGMRGTVTLAVIALCDQLTAGCGEVGPYMERDPAGPCIQRPSRPHNKGRIGTLWRGDMFVGNIGTGSDRLDAAVFGATTDNPDAHAEARVGRREHRIAFALIFGQWLPAIAIAAVGAYVTHGSGDERVTIPLGAAAAAADLMMQWSGLNLESDAHEHFKNAIAIYNANPPPGCGPAPPAASGPESE